MKLIKSIFYQKITFLSQNLKIKMLNSTEYQTKEQ